MSYTVKVKHFDWNPVKNEILKKERGVSFEDVVDAVDSDKVLTVINHLNPKKYQNQKFMIVEIDNYAYVIPFVEDDEKYFLKTIYPSREATKKYIIKTK